MKRLARRFGTGWAGRGRLARAAAVLAGLAACGWVSLIAAADERAPGSGGAAGRLVVRSGGNVQAALRETIAAFEKRTGCRVDYRCGPPGRLLSECLSRRDADVFVVGDLRHVRRAERDDVVAAKLPLAFLKLAIVVAKGNPKGIRRVADLARPGVRVYVEDPNGCQVADATARLLAANHLRIAPARATMDGKGPGPRTVGEFIRAGRLDAAIVWDLAAERMRGRLDVVEIPAPRNVGVNVVAVLFRFAGQKALAERFLLHQRSPAARAVWRRHGFRSAWPGAPAAAGPDDRQRRAAERMIRASRSPLAPVYAPLAEQIVKDFGLAGREGIGIDVGSGLGTLIVELCKRTRLHWINADINPSFFAPFYRLAEARGVGDRVSAVYADAKALPFRDGYADVIVSRGSYHFWGDRKKGFAEIYRVLKPGGAAYIGRGFPRDLPLETARKIRARQGGGPKYDRTKEAASLRRMMRELGIGGFRVHEPQPPGGADVNYGVWVEFRKAEKKVGAKKVGGRR